MSEQQTAPHGAWKSPITSDLIVSEVVGLSQPGFDGDSITWVEMRPSEGGRNVIVRRGPDGSITDINPQPYNARTRVHEYGGGDCVAHKGAVFFSNFSDQQIYLRSGEELRQVTSGEGMRYADHIYDPGRARLISIREEHQASNTEARNCVVSIDLENDGRETVLAEGKDFYSSPRLSRDGSKLAWLTWNHPNMPWDGTELWLGEFAADGTISEAHCVAGGMSESIFQPEWSPDGELYFVSDRNGWWNLYRLNRSEVEPLSPRAAEFGFPQWVFGMSSYGFVSSNRLVCSYVERGKSNLAILNTDRLELEQLDCPYSDIQYLKAENNKIVFRGGSPSAPAAIVELDLSSMKFQVLRQSMNASIDSGYLSQPEAIEFPTEDNLTAYGLYYRPRNRDYIGPEDERPPLLVRSHGGPTAAASASLNLTIQYFTSRGFAVLDVNYGGSTGYGREYRERLKGKWGIVDVDDCANGARYLAERGEVDSNRLMITGGSAGGYTTLCALTFRTEFKAGASHYGVSDVEALAKDTHKFESRYLDGMIGPYPEARELYLRRSPINFTERLSCPVIFFQGLEDKVVPPSQAEAMVEALKAKHLPVAYIAFAGEQHGFRQAKNIKRALDGEIYFYSRVFGFDLADEVEPVVIENL
ncbi:MAG TPA: S9 family peptidase [Pyrinomonadaceae bacterium]|nr:S9 family peptidase [Pyrinomonadaceae bacterium]